MLTLVSSHSWQETYFFIVSTRQQKPRAEGFDFEAVFASDITVNYIDGTVISRISDIPHPKHLNVQIKPNNASVCCNSKSNYCLLCCLVLCCVVLYA